MTKRVLIIGGYGNFGAHITKKLSADPALQLIVAGRSEEKCRALAERYKTEYCVLDIEKDFSAALARARPDIVIHTSGPFQGQGYGVAQACIAAGCHYVDLADGRDFVSNISTLDAAAKQAGVCVISGASSVPCLTAAVLDHFAPDFGKLTHVDYGIATVRTNTGLATTTAILGYTGKPFKTLIGGKMQDVYGWQDLHARDYPDIGRRLLGNCDIPDLALFPQRYKDLETLRFSAGMELSFLHLGLWGLSWLVRARIIRSLAPYAGFMLGVSRLFDRLGSDSSAFHMEMSGSAADGSPLSLTYYLIAKSGHGPFIPSIPSILCAQMLARGEIRQAGAYPCMGIISLAQYLAAISDLDIHAITRRHDPAALPRSRDRRA